MGIIERSQATDVPLHTHCAVLQTVGWAENIHVLEGVLELAVHGADGARVGRPSLPLHARLRAGASGPTHARKPRQFRAFQPMVRELSRYGQAR